MVTWRLGILINTHVLRPGGRVVFPALSRPRKRILAFLLDKPR